MVASALVAAVVPDKENKAPKDGTLRHFSGSNAGADQDAAQNVLTCVPDQDTAYSCTATVITGTTTGNSTSRDENGLQTDGNTSVTGGDCG